MHFSSGPDLIITESTSLLTGFSPEAGVQTYHAEQSLAYLILKNGPHDYFDESKLKIGVSTLCCHTCAYALSSLPVKTRGSHGQAYNNA